VQVEALRQPLPCAARGQVAALVDLPAGFLQVRDPGLPEGDLGLDLGLRRRDVAGDLLQLLVDRQPVLRLAEIGGLRVLAGRR